MSSLPGTIDEWEQIDTLRWQRRDHPENGVVTLSEGLSFADYWAKRIKDDLPPTTEELQEMDSAEVEKTFTDPSILRAIVTDRFTLENRIRALEGKQPITIAQFKSALVARIRGNT